MLIFQQLNSKLRPAFWVLIIFSSLILTFCIMYISAKYIFANSANESRARALICLDLQLTDLALMSSTRYIRHLSQSDLHSAFQDYPLAFDLFPNGSIVAPPRL